MKKKKVTSTRRRGSEDSATRLRLIEAAAQIVRAEGCAAVTARRLAEKFGLKRQIIHYYFRSIEDLLVAVIRRDSERICNLLSQSPSSENPLRLAAGEHSRNLIATALEFTALAARRKAIQVEVTQYIEKIRKIQAEALTAYLERRGIKPSAPPLVTIMIMENIFYGLAVEKALKVTVGHAELKAFAEDCLRAIEERGDIFSPKPA